MIRRRTYLPACFLAKEIGCSEKLFLSKILVGRLITSIEQISPQQSHLPKRHLATQGPGSQHTAISTLSVRTNHGPCLPDLSICRSRSIVEACRDPVENFSDMTMPRTQKLKFTVMFDAERVAAYCTLLRTVWNGRNVQSLPIDRSGKCEPLPALPGHRGLRSRSCLSLYRAPNHVRIAVHAQDHREDARLLQQQRNSPRPRLGVSLWISPAFRSTPIQHRVRTLDFQCLARILVTKRGCAHETA